MKVSAQSDFGHEVVAAFSCQLDNRCIARKLRANQLPINLLASMLGQQLLACMQKDAHLLQGLQPKVLEMQLRLVVQADTPVQSNHGCATTSQGCSQISGPSQMHATII